MPDFYVSHAEPRNPDELKDVDFEKPEGRLPLAKHLFEFVKEKIEHGCKIEMPIFCMVGRIPLKTNDGKESDIIFIDNTITNAWRYKHYGDTLYGTDVVELSLKQDVCMLARASEQWEVPEHDRKAWIGKKNSDHPKAKRCLTVTLTCDSKKDEVFIMTAEIDNTRVLRKVGKSRIVILDHSDYLAEISG